MYCSQIYFSTVPKIGFAHHFCTEKAHNTYYGKEKSIEIAYVEKGNLYGKFNDFYFEANEGDFLVLSRHQLIRITACSLYSNMIFHL